MSASAFGRVAALLPEALWLIVELSRLRSFARIASASRTGRDSVRAVLPRQHCQALSLWAGRVWIADVAELQDAARSAIGVGAALPRQLRHALLEELTDLAAQRNRCPARVGLLCYTRSTPSTLEQSGHGGVRQACSQQIAIRFDFRCPRRHGMLRPIRGIPAAYAMHHGTNDLTLACTHCQRLQIEEDAMFLHCPWYGCCYDLCLVCAEGLCCNRRWDVHGPEIST